MFAMSSTGCSRFYQEAVVSADMRCIGLSEGKQIERKMDFLKIRLALEVFLEIGSQLSF